MNPLLEHTARILDHQPTRSMEAEPLYRRAVREAGIDVSFPEFMRAVRERTDCFAVIAPDPMPGATDLWDARHRCLYEAALEAAGLMQPVVVLTLRPHAKRDPDVAAAQDPLAGVLGEAHEALTHLLRGADPDDPLHSAVMAALDELHAIRRTAVS